MGNANNDVSNQCIHCGQSTPTWDLHDDATRAACHCGWTGDITLEAIAAKQAAGRHDCHNVGVETVAVCGHCRVVLCDHDIAAETTPHGRAKCGRCQGVEVSG